MQMIKVDRARMLKWIFVLFIIALGVNAVRLVHSRLVAQERRLGKTISYTVIVRETVYGPDGTASVAADETFAVRSDGSCVDILTHKKQIGNKLADNDSGRQIYLASGTTVEINDFTGAKSTTVSKINPAKFQRDPSTKCINSLDGTPQASPQDISGEEVVAGYRTVKITSKNWTRWFALDHGCAMVKLRVDWGSQGYSEKNLIALIPGEPAATLFDVPPDDKEMAPSERILGRGKDISSCGWPRCAETLRKLDEEYKAGRLKK